MNLDNDGTISQSAGEGKFLFTSASDNTISGTSTPLFDILETGKTGTANISLQQNIQVDSGIFSLVINYGDGKIKVVKVVKQ